MNTASRLVLPFYLSISLCLATPSATGSGEGTPRTRVIPRSAFRYVIIYNDVVDALQEMDPSRTGPKQRFLDILIEERAFTEENLRELYKNLSRRFPDPRLLTVSVVTNLTDTETPEEHDAPRMSEPEGPSPPEPGAHPRGENAPTPRFIGHPHAMFIRTDRTEIIRYWYPTPKGEKEEEILFRSNATRKGP